MFNELDEYINTIIESIYTDNEINLIMYDLSMITEKYGLLLASIDSLENKNEKISKAREIISKCESPITIKFLNERIRNKEYNFFDPSIFELFCEGLHKSLEKCLIIQITVATVFKPADIKEFAIKLTEKLGRKVLLSIIVDKKIIGGAIIKKGNYMMDYSIKTRLDNFKNEWREGLRIKY